MRLTPAKPPIHQLLPQSLHIHLLPLRNGGIPAATGSGNGAVQPYLVCVSWTRMSVSTGRKNLKKFWSSMRRRTRRSISRTAWKCKTILRLWFTVDGIASREARNAEKRMATHLAAKWNREYSQMVYLCEGSDGNRGGPCKQPPHL